MAFLIFLITGGLSGGITYHLTHLALLSIGVGIIAGLWGGLIIVEMD